MVYTSYKPTEIDKHMYQHHDLNAAKEVLLDAGYYLNQLMSGIGIKAFIASFAGLYSGLLNGQWFLVLVFYFLTLIDLAFGTTAAVIRKKWSVHRFGKWVIKLITYSVCILVVGLVNGSLARITGNFEILAFKIPLLDCFLILLIVTEAMSIFCNLDRMGWAPPVEAMRIINNIHNKTVDRIDEATKTTNPPPEGDRRKAWNANEDIWGDDVEKEIVPGRREGDPPFVVRIKTKEEKAPE